MAGKGFRGNMAGKQGNRGVNTPALTKLEVLLIVIDKIFTAKHRTTKWDLAGFVSANAAMYAMLFLVACDMCGFTMCRRLASARARCPVSGGV